jgi:hypothetical protein
MENFAGHILLSVCLVLFTNLVLSICGTYVKKALCSFFVLCGTLNLMMEYMDSPPSDLIRHLSGIIPDFTLHK